MQALQNLQSVQALGRVSAPRWSSPVQPLQGNRPSLWLRADQGVYTGGARQFYQNDGVYFASADTDINITNPATQSITLEAFIYVDSLTGMDDTYVGAGIITNQISDAVGSYSFGVTSTGRLGLFMRESAGDDADGIKLTATGTITAGAWYHVVAVWTAGSGVTFYVNGSTVATNTTRATSTGWGALKSIGNSFIFSSFTVKSYQFNGRIAKARVWMEAKDSSYVTESYDRGNGLVYGQLSDTTNLGTSLNLNEVSATSNAIDTTGNMTWTLTNQELLSNTGFETVTQTYGARQYDIASSRHHLGTDNATLEIGDNDAWFAGWVYLDAKTTSQALMAKWKVTGSNDREYSLWYFHTTDRFRLEVSVDGSATANATASTFGSPSTATWYFLFGYHDAVNNTINISVNGGAFDSAAHAGGIFAGAGKFVVGADDEGTRLFMGGRLSRLAIGKSPSAGIDSLATTIRDALYNSGKGRLYAALSTSQKTDWGLVEYWNGDETTSADLTGDHATITLTNTNSVGVANDMGPQANFGSWSESGTTGATINDETSAPDAGSHALRMEIDSSGGTASVSQSVLTVGHRYLATVRAKISSDAGSNQGRIEFGSSANYALDLTTSYATYNSGNITCAGSGVLSLLNVGGDSFGDSLFFDTVSVKAVDIPAADGPESEIAADSIGSLHGVLTSFTNPETAWASDKPSAISTLVDGSLVLDGTGYVTVADSASHSFGNGTTDSPFSVSFWCKGSEAGGIISKSRTFNQGEYYVLYDLATTSMYFRIVDQSASAYKGVFVTATMADWTHVLVTYSGSGTEAGMQIYINGVAGSKTGSSAGTYVAMENTTVDLNFGRRNTTGGDEAYAGSVADVRFYSEAVSQANATALAAGTDYTTNLVSRWKLDDGPQSGIADGDPVIRWTSLEGSYHDFEQATASKRPLYVASAINSKPGISLDGTDDILVKASSFLTGTAGTIIAVFRTGASLNDFMGLVGTFDGSSDNRYIIARANGSSGVGQKPEMSQQNADTQDAVQGSTTTAINTSYVNVYSSSGTAYSIRVNGNDETESARSGSNGGDWWDDSTSQDVTSLGASKFGVSGETQFFRGYLCEVIIYPINLSASSLAAVSAYMQDRYGVSA